MRLNSRFALRLAAAVLCLSSLAVTAASAADYPTRPVHIIVGYPPGGSTDILARLVGNYLSGKLHQQFVVENKPGAGNNIGTEAVINSPPDGYTVYLVNPANGINATLYKKLNFNFVRDMAPVGGITRVPNVMTVHPSVPAKTVAEFITYAKANPGKINMASSGNGTSVHLSGELFMAMTGVKMTHVPYRGSANAVTDVMGGRVDVMLDTATSGFPRIRSGQFRALAVTSPTRYPLLPDAPTIAETLPGLHYMSWLGMAAAPHTPRPIVDRLNSELHRALALPEIQAKLKDGGNIATPTTPEGMRQQIADEIANWKNLIVANNIKVN
jgi:tripartite-type tricarboxylate transporter receptor subunit TctC